MMLQREWKNKGYINHTFRYTEPKRHNILCGKIKRNEKYKRNQNMGKRIRRRPRK